MTRDRERLAPAKINLTLHVTGQGADGYHRLDSLVVFTEFGDRVALAEGLAGGKGGGLTVTGPYAWALAGAGAGDNLVSRAARLVGQGDAALVLDKRLPVASGMGGGSSDAAAALHLLAEACGATLPGTEALMRLGADLPVCLAAPRPQRMRGLGERVEPVPGVPALALLLVNPGQGLATPSVFKALTKKNNPPMPPQLPRWPDARAFCDWLAGMRNDLQAPAMGLMPAIGAVLAMLRAQPGCRLARMTGSGATCFAVFDDDASARAAESALVRPGWFVKAAQTVGSAG